MIPFSTGICKGRGAILVRCNRWLRIFQARLVDFLRGLGYNLGRNGGIFVELGERIYTMRAARGLSQTDLADALEVSRQSVSKWETGASVPELDKLMKLSQLFGVSLDELVTGQSPEASTDTNTQETAAPVPSERSHGQSVAGVILLCFAGLVWLFVRRRAGLWCAWVVSILVDLFLWYGTGIRWGMIFQTLQWEASWNYTRLAMAWGMFFVLAALIVATALCFRREPMARTRRNLALLAVGTAVLMGLVAAMYLPIWGHATYFLTSFVLQWVRTGLLAAVITGLVRLRAGAK